MNTRVPSFKHLLIGLGYFAFLIAGVFAILIASPIHAQPPVDADYLGRRDCVSCHHEYRNFHVESAHNRTLLEPDEVTAILADFSQGAELRIVMLPGATERRAFTVDDVAFVVGSGRHIQRYLYEADDNQLLVLPAEWNVIEQTWQPYTLEEPWPDAAYEWGPNCAGCHTTGLDIAEYAWEEDAVQCEACHGPGSVHADAVDDAGREIDAAELQIIRDNISRGTDPQICGSCHSAGVEVNHPFSVDYYPGQPLLDGYQLVMPDDTTHWSWSDDVVHKNLQFNGMVLSGHDNALATMLESDAAEDSCLQCHSSDYLLTEALLAEYADGTREGEAPPPITLATAQNGVTCANCHTTHSETEFDSLLVESPETLCLGCHQDTSITDGIHHPVVEMFNGQQIIDNVPSISSNHVEAGATCVTCHMPSALQVEDTWYAGSHSMQVVFADDSAEGQPNSCTGCHTDLSGEYLQEFVESTQMKVSDRLATIQVVVDGRDNLPQWVDDAVDLVVGDGSLGIHNYAYTNQLLAAVEAELRIAIVDVPDMIPVHEIEDPQDCAECHEDEHNEWHQSPHANASLSQTFQQEYASTGRPSYCMNCHASGYDPSTERYVFEGVVCSNCHYTTGGSEHPPGPVELATDSQVCGRCHSGAHAPTYDEWLVSDHSALGIDCIDCHTPHDNGLLLGTINETCGSCHQEALVDEVHMGQDMNCVDCHMTQEMDEDSIYVARTGHTMNIDPGVCADCHGNTHELTSDGMSMSVEEHEQLVVLEAEVAELEQTASQNLNSGIVGGALGALVLVLIIFLTVRLGRLR